MIKNAFKALFRWIASIPYAEIARQVINFIGDILHRALFTVLLPKRYRSLTKQQIYTIIFKADTPAGKKFDIWLLVLIGINIITIMMESMAGTAAWFSWTMRAIGWLFTILFTFEYYLRIYCLNKPWKYVLSFYGIIDFLSIFPAWLSLLVPAISTLSVLRLMRMLRIFRIFKMKRFLREARFLMNSLRRSAVKVLIFMMFVFIIAVILGATMYGIEGETNPAISSIPRGVYWAIVTITTVGYGDIAPVTATGQFISTIVMLLGYSIIAVPTGIVAGETIEEHNQHRHRRKHGSHTHTTEPSSEPNDDTTEPEQLPSKTSLSNPDPAAHVRSEDLM
jgi:voltage-gated potassium channel